MWKHYPALYLGLCFLLGIANRCYPWLFLLLLCIPKKKLWWVVLAGYLYFQAIYPAFPPSEKGAALFHIKEVKNYNGPFNTSFAYIGTIKNFRSAYKTWHNIPCCLYVNHRKNRPKANCDYWIPVAELYQIAPYRYILKSTENWIPLDHTFSLAEWRFQAKEKIKKIIQPYYKERRTYSLMSALLTGNLSNRILSHQFASVGLQHLLAISGFHFALLTLFIAYIFKRFLPEKIMALCLIVLLSGYFFYMGSSPSVSRAWIGVMLFLTGTLFSFRPTPLNALGIALLASLVSDPLIITNIGFQLSFGATLGILLFYTYFEKRFEAFFPKRSFKHLKEMTYLNQWGYLCCAYIRKILSLNGSVLIFTFPLLLFHFHTFPFLSLIYNLFFPLFFSFLIGGFILGLFIPGVHLINSYYASFLLDLIENAPKALMFYITPKPALIVGVIAIYYMASRVLIKND